MAIEDILARAEKRKEQGIVSPPTEQGIENILNRAAQRRDTSEKGRAFAQGMTFGFADEIEAIARAATGENYDEAVAEIRNKLKAYQQAHPGEALTMEMLGAVAPTAAMMMTGVGAPAAATRLGGIARTAATGALEAGVTAFGTGEGGIAERAGRVPAAAATGAIAAPVMGGVIAGSGMALGKFTNFVRSKFGDRLAGPVEAEVNRLAQETGKTPDEIINDLIEGRLMTENQSLVKSLRAYRGQGGEAGAKITETIGRRAQETQSRALDDLQRGLAPEASDNVYRDIRLGEKEFKSKQSKAYGQIFAKGQEISREMTDTLSEALTRMPNAGAELNAIYKARGGLVPFFEIGENGALKIIRQPTVEDAEIVRRALAESASKAYREGSGTIGEPISDLEKTLRRQLDDEAPDLATTRKNWSELNKARDAFDTGRKILTGDMEEKLFTIEQVLQRNNEGEIKALRAGMMNQLKNKFSTQGTAAKRLADENSKEGQIFRALYPDGPERQRVIRNLETAGIAKDVERQVKYGSPTSQDIAAAKRIGSNVSAADIQGAAVGHLPSIARVGSGLIKSISPDLTPKQREQVVGIIMSEDPDVLRRAFYDDTAMSALQRRVGSILGFGAETTKTGILQQLGEQSGNVAPVDFTGKLNAL